MRKLLFAILLGLALVSVGGAAGLRAEDDLPGFTLKQLDRAIGESGVAGQRIYSILTFGGEEGSGVNVAILSGARTGWSVVVLHRAPAGLTVAWRSGKLSEDFAVSAPGNLAIGQVGDEEVVEFSGCAAHECNGLGGEAGMLLYSPRARQAFFAHYRSGERKPAGSFGDLTFSENADKPANSEYKAALRKDMNTVLHAE